MDLAKTFQNLTQEEARILLDRIESETRMTLSQFGKLDEEEPDMTIYPIDFSKGKYDDEEEEAEQVEAKRKSAEEVAAELERLAQAEKADLAKVQRGNIEGISQVQARYTRERNQLNGVPEFSEEQQYLIDTRAARAAKVSGAIGEDQPLEKRYRAEVSQWRGNLSKVSEIQSKYRRLGLKV